MQIPKIGFNHKKSKNAEFEIVKLESLYNRGYSDHHPEHPHRIKFFNLMYIEEGEGIHMVDFENYSFSAGSFIFVQREQVHAFNFDFKIKGKMLLFTQAFLDQVHANMRLPSYTPTHLNSRHTPLIRLDEASNTRCKSLVNEIIKEIENKHANPLIVMYLFSALSLMLNRVGPTLGDEKLSNDQRGKFARFIDLLNLHFYTKRDANWYSLQLHTTYKTLNQICKLATALTAKQLIDSYTIIEIKRRLIVSNATSQQLAYDFGFEDASNFVKYFKNQTSFTPSQFQRKHRQTVL